MSKFINLIMSSKKVAFMTVFSVSVLAGAAFIFVPNIYSLSKAYDCNNPPLEATFNPYGVTGASTAGTDCYSGDFPVISIRNTNGTYGSFSNSLSGNVGDEFYVRVWVHNGATDSYNDRDDSDPDKAKTIAHNVSGNISVSGGTISTNFSGSKSDGSYIGGTNSGNAFITLPSGAHLEVVQGSGEAISQRSSGSINTTDSGANFSIGTQYACFPYAVQFYIKVKIVGSTVVPSTLNLNLDKSDYCVGEYPTYTVNGSADLAGQSIIWSSTLNGGSTGENNTYPGHVLDSNGHFSQQASSAWQSNHIGSWTKTATVNGVSSSASFTVRSCATAQPKVLSFNVNPPTCASNDAQVSWTTQNFDNIEVKVNNNILSGEESFTKSVDWLVPGYTYAFTFWNNGSLVDTKNYTVPNLNCNEPTLSCRLSNNNPSTLYIGDSAQFVATGGNNQFSWSSEGSPSTGSGTLYETAFATAGNKTVTVQSGSQTVTCYANILARTQPANLTCTPGNVTLDINQSQNFTAAGGEGTEIWTVDDVTVSQAFSTITRSFSTSGQHYVTVRKGSQQATCNVTVRAQGGTQTYTATASATASASASAVCSNGTSASATASASASATATSNISQADAQNKAQTQAQANAQAQAQANAQAQAQVNCPSNPVNPPTLTCPDGQVFLSRSTVNQGESTTASAPNGFSGGYFESNPYDVYVSGNTITARMDAIGSTLVVGKNWTYNFGNGQTVNGCNLRGSELIIQRQPVQACVQRTFSSNSGLFVNGSRVTAPLTPNQSFTVSCDYGVKSARITLEGNGANGCGFSGWNGNAAQFSCTTPSQAGSYSVSCRMTNNVSEDNSCNSTDVAGSYTVSQAQPPALSCNSLNSTVYVNQAAGFTANGGTGSYSWSNGGNPSSGTGSSFSTSFSSSGYKTVTVQSGSQSANCSVNVIPQQVSQLTCELISGLSSVNINDTVSFRASGGNGTYAFNASTGNPATQSSSSNNIFSTQYATAGGKYVTVISDGQIANCPVVTVNQPTQNLTCSANSAQVYVNNSVSFTANGGTGSYSWSNGGNPSSGTGSSFSTSFSSSGYKTVTVQSGSQSAACSTQVIENVIPDVVCSPANQTANINQSVYFTATGGNGSFSWSANGSNNQTGSGNSFSTAYQTSGSKTVTVSSAGKTSVCNVNVLQVQPQTLSCSPATQTVNINDIAHFNAIGGTAPYNWSAPGSNNPSAIGSAFNTYYSASGQKTVNLTSADGQSVNCNVNVNPPTPTPTPTPTPVTTGNCNNSQASCNNNQNNNNQTSTGNNSANQNNQSNINGNNNTVTQTNNNCVNNSCNNTIYYIQGGQTVSQNDYRQLSIEKQVRNLSYNQANYFQNSVTAYNGDTVEFQIIVRSSGNQTVNNVVLTDNLPSGLSYVSGQFNGQMNIGTMYANDTRTITFQARVNGNSGQSIQNLAYVRGDGVSQLQDDAWVFVGGGNVQGGSVNLSFSKKAINESKATYAGQQVDATSVNASREDFITYTLTVTNSGNTPANSFVITDDLSQVLPYADIVDNGGGNISGNVITFPGITVPANGSVSKSFKVRVKYSLASNLSYTMSNTYGNVVNIRINTPQVLGAFVAPKTGADTMGISFAMLLTLGFVGFKKRELISKLVLNS